MTSNKSKGSSITSIANFDIATAPRPASDGAKPAPRITKASIILDLLRREQGATLSELVAATGWLPHTTRAALTGLRKKGHVLDKYIRDDVTCYRTSAA